MKPVAIPETFSKIRDSILVIVLLFLAQLLIAGIEESFDKLNCSFPPSILAMTFVFATSSLLTHFWPRLDDLYIKYLRSPVSLSSSSRHIVKWAWRKSGYILTDLHTRRTCSTDTCQSVLPFLC